MSVSTTALAGQSAQIAYDSFGPSKNYRAFIPAQQFLGSGNAKDKSGNGADAALSASLTDATAWAANGYLTTAAGTNAGTSIPKAKTEFDLATQSFILSARINIATPGASVQIITVGDGVSSQGFYLSGRATTGKIRPVITSSAGVVNGLADSTATFCDGTDHVVTLAVDGLTKSIYLFRDGALSDTYTNVFSGGTPARSTDFFIGQAANGTAIAAKFSGLHFLVFNGGLPLNTALIAQILASAPHSPLSASQVQL